MPWSSPQAKSCAPSCRVRGAREDMLEFRLTHNELDPTQSAEATLKIAAELQGERSRLASQLASLTGYSRG